MRRFFLAALSFLSLCLSANAGDIFLSGKNLKLSSWGIKKVGDGIGFWGTNQASGWWNFEVMEEGDYHIFLTVSGTAQNAGATVNVLLNDKSFSNLKVPDTESLENFKLVRITESKVHLKKGVNKLLLKAPKVNGKELARFGFGLVTDKESLEKIPEYRVYEKHGDFAETFTWLKSNVSEMGNPSVFRLNYKSLWNDFPHEMVWLTQDLTDLKTTNMNPEFDFERVVCDYFAPNRDCSVEKSLVARAISELPENAQKKYRAMSEKIGNAKPTDPRWLKLYSEICKERRKIRIAPLLKETDKIIFAKHQVFGSRSGIYNVTEYEGLFDFETSSLNTLDLSPEQNGEFAKVSILKDAEGGILRDPSLSPDGNRLLFAWRPTSEHRSWAVKNRDYKIYEMDLTTKACRKLTSDETYGSDYEATYLPNGNIIFNSSRIVQHITCGWGDHSNLFVMDKDGKYQRRFGFDQVSTQFPTVLNNGQVVYLRRDYNDRGQVAAHALFVMNQDGTGQTEFYGNQTGTPTSFMHPAPIPNSHKILAVLSGYHTRQGGMLAMIDVREGRNHGKGVTLIPQGTPPKSSGGIDDGYGKIGVQYANPIALNEKEFVVCRSETWCPGKSGGEADEKYGIYFMSADGRRELLTNDPNTSCLQPVLWKAREMPPARPTMTDYTKKEGTFYVQNVYEGAAAIGITNKVKKLRVIEILYKHDTVKWGRAQGPGGSEHSVTAPAHPLALFDAKRIIGDATVYEDGSAMFSVPARTPVYFQLLDEKNQCVQTMRSWSTLMPNERFSCVGCHEDKNDTPASNKRTMAMEKGVEKLTPFYGEPRGFSYQKEIQPIWDKHCISCHNDKCSGKKLVLTSEPFMPAPDTGREWSQSYTQLMAARPGPDPEIYSVKNGPESWIRWGKAKTDEPNRYVTYGGRLSRMDFFPPYTFGATQSGILRLLEKGHKGVKISQEEWDKIAAWIDLNCPYSGDYLEGNIWTPKQLENYKKRIVERERNEAIEADAIRAYIDSGQLN